jgi:hypothetical protein
MGAMNKPLLHFTHGNSYPSGAYGRLLDELGRDFDVRTTDMLGHDPRYPGGRQLARADRRADRPARTLR